jgi:hypothetical protein
MWRGASIAVCLFSGSASADNECGAAVAGGSITCDAASYTTGPDDNIRYRIDGLNLTADGIVVTHQESLQPAVHIRAENTHTGDLNGSLVNGVTFITGDSGNPGIVSSSAIPGRYADGLRAEQRGAGEAHVTMQSGSINTYGWNAMGIYAWQRNFNLAGTGAVSSTLSGGGINTSGGYAHGVYGRTDSGLADVTVTTGDASILTRGHHSDGVRALVVRPNSQLGAPASTANLLVTVDGTIINTQAQYARGVWAGNNHALGTGNATMNISNASVTTAGDDAVSAGAELLGSGNSALTLVASALRAAGAESHGVFARSGTGNVAVQIDAASLVRADGADADGVLAGSDSGAVNVDVAGQVVSGSSAAAGLHLHTSGTATVVIQSGATVDGSASGVSIRGGDVDRDGVDEVAGALVVTTEGTVDGDAYLGLGDDEFSLLGGVFTGDIYGDDATATPADGDDSFSWQGGDLNSGFFGGNGSDAASIGAGANYEATEVMDGGDDVAGGDGWVDTLSFDRPAADIDGATLLNWEQINLAGGSYTHIGGATALVTGSEAGQGLTLAATALLLPGPVFNLQGNIQQLGEIDMLAGNAATDVVNVTGTYTGAGGVLRMDVVLGDETSPADRLVVTGDTTGNTQIAINAISGAGAATSGDGILLVEVSGTSAATFSLAGEVRAGDYVYRLSQVANNWYLQAAHSPVVSSGGAGNAEPIPTLGVWLQLLLAGMLAGIAARHQRQ